MRQGFAAVLFAAALVSPASSAERDAVIAAYANVCPAALLAPADLPAALERAGLTQSIGLPLGNTRTQGYATPDNDLSVSVITHTFGDSVHRNCMVVTFEALGFDGLKGARAAIEANALVGPLEGTILPLPAGNIVTAYLKRPGLDPIVFASLNATSGSATLVLESLGSDAMIAAAVFVLAAAANPGYAETFTAAFAEACVPQRMSYDGTRETAKAAGWQVVPETDHPELAAMMQKAVTEAASDPNYPMTFAYETYRREVAGSIHHLVVSRGEMDAGTLGVFKEIGCYLYNFDATDPIDPTPVTALIEKPISNAMEQDGVVSYVWGPPCPMPRTGDTYLTLIREGSRYAADTGFTGLLLKFSTSEPDPGEVVPDTYC